jgi:hypothetical protein
MASTPNTVRQNGELLHRGPSLVAVGAVFTALFVASLIVSTAMAGGAHFPSPFQPELLSSSYFAEHAWAVRVGAFLQFGAAVPLGIFTATAVSRVRFLGVNVAGTLIGLFGGFAASLMLALSALTQWTLSQPGITGSTSLVHALHLLAFATGGPGYVVPAGLLVAGVSVSAGLNRLVPPWLMWFGLVVAGVSELSALSLVIPTAMYLLPLARFSGFVWMICAGAALPKARAVAAIRKDGGNA